MNKEKRATLQTLLMVEYTDILLKARRGIKGLRLNHLFPIQLLGEYPDGLSITEAGKLSNRTPQAMYFRFKTVIVAGYVKRENKRYYLTDKGKEVYSRICSAFSVSFKKIVRALVEEANR